MEIVIYILRLFVVRLLEEFSLSLSILSSISKRRNEPTIERAVDAALVKPLPSALDLLALLLREILIGFVCARISNVNFNSAMNASPGVI